MPKKPSLTAYELERAANIAQNARLLASLGLGSEPGVKPKPTRTAQPAKTAVKRSRSVSTSSSRSSETDLAPASKRQAVAARSRKSLTPRTTSAAWDIGNSDSEDDLVTPKAPSRIRDFNVRLCRHCQGTLEVDRAETPDLLEDDIDPGDRMLCLDCQSRGSNNLGSYWSERGESHTSTEPDYSATWRESSVSDIYMPSPARLHTGESSATNYPSSKGIQATRESSLSLASSGESSEEEELEIGGITSCKIIDNELHFHTTWKDRGPTDDTFQPFADLQDTVALDEFVAQRPVLVFRGQQFSLASVMDWRAEGCMMDKLTRATRGKASVKMKR